jgi:hypothetical protein
LALDAAFFSDGVCVGPNETKLFEEAESAIRARTELSNELAAELRKGATAGQILDRIKPESMKYRMMHGPGPAEHPNHSRAQFLQSILHSIIRLPDDNLLRMFEQFSRPPTMQLRRG